MLARHGYGVLLFDRRGEGKSDDEPNSWGWGGTKDVKAAVAYLQRRPDVQPNRIGGLGLSVGGEMMLDAASNTKSLAAVVSEGAGARMFTEEMDQDLPPFDDDLAALDVPPDQPAKSDRSPDEPLSPPPLHAPGGVPTQRRRGEPPG